MGDAPRRVVVFSAYTAIDVQANPTRYYLPVTRRRCYLSPPASSPIKLEARASRVSGIKYRKSPKLYNTPGYFWPRPQALLIPAP